MAFDDEPAAVAFMDDYLEKNGYPDGDEEDSIGYYSVNYINGAEASDEECAAYGAGEYEAIKGVMDWKTLKTKL